MIGLYVLIWLVGSVLNYILWKKDIKGEFKSWTKSDRSIVLLISILGSWFAMIPVLFSMLGKSTDEASW